MACCLLAAGCKARQERVVFGSGEIGSVLSKMTEVMVHDVTNPPLAARFFAYASLAGYEIVSRHDSAAGTMKGVLNGYPDIAFAPPAGYDYQLAALLAMTRTAARMQPSGGEIRAFEKQLLDSLRNAGVSPEMIGASGEYADSVVAAILRYAKADGYNRISNYPRYEPRQAEGQWYPTPPAYMAAVEPYFNRVRPFTLDSAQQFKSEAPIPFSADPHSAFFQLMELNYKDSLTAETGAIAEFWDCNPFAVENRGHLMSAVKKISPGAHWLGITAIACKQAGKGFDESMKIFTGVSVTMTDAFISCWDEKFRSNRIRPETAIRKYIDPGWQPLLQTPPFPEYTSGHSVVSAAVATVLTGYFGEGFAYTDDVEVPYGLPARKYASFAHAMDEAAISRFYGGIHFMDAIENGKRQGSRIGIWAMGKLK